MGDRPGREQASTDHDPEQGIFELALILHPRISRAHETHEPRVIPAERLLNLLQLALLVCWERHDASREKGRAEATVSSGAVHVSASPSHHAAAGISCTGWTCGLAINHSRSSVRRSSGSTKR